MKLSDIDNLETAKQALRLLESENNRLHRKLEKLITENAELKGESASKQLSLELLKLKEQMSAMQSKMFGRSSERRITEEKKADREKKRQKKKKGKQSKKNAQKELPLVTVQHEIAKDDMNCQSCGGVLKAWDGQFETFEEIDVIEREFRMVRHKRQKYRCTCGCAPVTAPGPLRIPGSKFSLNFAITTAIDKWGMHLPHVRQADKMELQGFSISDAQLWQQSEQLATILQDTHDALGEHITNSELVHVDETPWPILNKDKKKWWVWTFSDYDSVYVCIDPSRGHEVPKRVLEGSQAILIVDAYSAYAKLVEVCPGMRKALCWSHLRRKFIEAEKSYPEAAQALDLIAELFMIERELPDFREMEGDKRVSALDAIVAKRNQESRPIVEALEVFLKNTHALPQSRLGKAIRYAANHWEGFKVFLDAPQVPLTNNQAERTLRSPVLGRKNHYGSKSKRGTEVAALYYSLIGTCRMLQIDPSKYLYEAACVALANPGEVLLPHDFARRA